MQVKQLRAPGHWQVSALLEGLDTDEGGGSQAIPITIRFRVADGVAFLRAWAWGHEIEAEDAWAAESWLQEHEDELLEAVDRISEGSG